MMIEPWYEAVEPSQKLTQGDLIFDCPLLAWDPLKLPRVYEGEEAEILKPASRGFAADVVVMTQACDLEHGHVQNVVLCSHMSLSASRTAWDEWMKEDGHNPTDKSFRSYCVDVNKGHIWNQAFINRSDLEPKMAEIRLVEFNEVFTVPVLFLQSILEQRNKSRLRLRPPYREHLSQSFARYFMRVGLPEPVTRGW